MKKIPSAVLVALVSSACAGGPPVPPSLEYGPAGAGDLTYAYASETSVSVSMMGQSMSLTQEGTATYDVGLTSSAQGMNVRLTVAELDATISNPMGAPLTIDESAIDGALVFSLDRTGNAVVTSEPDVAVEASQMFSGLSLANGFFPGLPGRAVVPGDQWTDTVSYEGNESVFTYTVAGDTVVDGRSLLVIDLDGTTESEFEVDVQGMAVTQSSELSVEGRVLWDYQASIMFEVQRTAEGQGTVRIPMAPGPLPIRVESTERARVQDR